MIKRIAFAVVLTAISVSAVAQTPAAPPVLQLPPREPAAAPVKPVAVPAISAAPILPATPAPAPATCAVCEAEKPKAERPKPRRAVARKPAPKKPEPFADLPVPDPAKDALRFSQGWADSDSAIVTRGADGRVVFVFGETMPAVVCAPNRMCVIELQAGEKVMGEPHVADTLRWKVAPGIVGEGESRVVNVIVKPTEAGLDTSLLIPTNRRMYRLRLVSDERNYVSVISFDYPDDQRAAWDAVLAVQDQKEEQVVADLPPMSVDALDFDYGITVKRGRPVWKPLRVFNDGLKTYIQLPPSVTDQDVPALVALAPNGEEQLVNFRMRGPYFVVDRVIQRAALLSGVGRDGERVELEYGCARRNAFGKCKG